MKSAIKFLRISNELLRNTEFFFEVFDSLKEGKKSDFLRDLGFNLSDYRYKRPNEIFMPQRQIWRTKAFISSGASSQHGQNKGCLAVVNLEDTLHVSKRTWPCSAEGYFNINTNPRSLSEYIKLEDVILVRDNGLKVNIDYEIDHHDNVRFNYSGQNLGLVSPHDNKTKESPNTSLDSLRLKESPDTIYVSTPDELEFFMSYLTEGFTETEAFKEGRRMSENFWEEFSKRF